MEMYTPSKISKLIDAVLLPLKVDRFNITALNMFTIFYDFIKINLFDNLVIG
jgi:hypothetical protein